MIASTRMFMARVVGAGGGRLMEALSRSTNLWVGSMEQTESCTCLSVASIIESTRTSRTGAGVGGPTGLQSQVMAGPPPPPLPLLNPRLASFSCSSRGPASKSTRTDACRRLARNRECNEQASRKGEPSASTIAEGSSVASPVVFSVSSTREARILSAEPSVDSDSVVADSVMATGRFGRDACPTDLRLPL